MNIEQVRESTAAMTDAQLGALGRRELEHASDVELGALWRSWLADTSPEMLQDCFKKLEAAQEKAAAQAQPGAATAESPTASPAGPMALDAHYQWQMTMVLSNLLAVIGALNSLAMSADEGREEFKASAAVLRGEVAALVKVYVPTERPAGAYGVVAVPTGPLHPGCSHFR